MGMNLNENDIKKMFQELDVAKIGEIDFSALVNAAVHDYLIASDQRLYEAFRDLDDDEDGKIKTSELKEKLRKMDVYGKADELISIIDSVDLDKDGTIDYEEFLRALHPDFNEAPNWMMSSTMSPGAPEHSDSNSKSDSNSEENLENFPMEDDVPTMESSDSNAVLLQGYMKKEGKFVKSWKKRWFVLTVGGKMSYYQNQKETQPLGTFSCRNLLKLKKKGWKNKEFGLKVYTAHRNWKLLLLSEEERAKWHSAIKSVSTFYYGNAK